MIFSGPGFVGGFVVGFGTGFVSREIGHAGLAVIRPLTRATLRAGMMAYEKGREYIERAGERLDDVIAEVNEELSRIIKPTKKHKKSVKKSDKTHNHEQDLEQQHEQDLNEGEIGSHEAAASRKKKVRSHES